MTTAPDQPDTDFDRRQQQRGGAMVFVLLLVAAGMFTVALVASRIFLQGQFGPEADEFREVIAVDGAYRITLSALRPVLLAGLALLAARTPLEPRRRIACVVVAMVAGLSIGWTAFQMAGVATRQTIVARLDDGRQVAFDGHEMTSKPGEQVKGYRAPLVDPIDLAKFTPRTARGLAVTDTESLHAVEGAVLARASYGPSRHNVLAFWFVQQGAIAFFVAAGAVAALWLTLAGASVPACKRLAAWYGVVAAIAVVLG
jgi:hypothetical protein